VDKTLEEIREMLKDPGAVSQCVYSKLKISDPKLTTPPLHHSQEIHEDPSG